MQTFEEVIDAFHRGAREHKLQVMDVQSWVDTIRLDRSYRMLIVPEADPPPHRIRTELSFSWPAKYTVESTHGPTCCMYHDPEDSCVHQELEPDAGISIEGRYLLDVRDADAATDLGTRVRQVIEQVVEYENAPQIHFAIADEGDGPLDVTEVSAISWWELDVVRAVEVAPLLREISKVLAALLESDLLPKDEGEDEEDSPGFLRPHL